MHIKIHPCTPDDWAYLAMYFPAWSARYEYVFAPQAEVYSGFVDGRMVGAAGFLFHAPKQAYCWGVFLADRWPRYPRRLLEAIMAQRDAVATAHHLWRLEARADCAHWQACRFLEALGFQGEGIMRAANEAGEDQFLYSLLTPAGQAQRSVRLGERYGGQHREIETARVEYLLTQVREVVNGPSVNYRSGARRGGGNGRNGVVYSSVECGREECEAECQARE